MHKPFGEVLQERVGFIEHSLARIEQGEGSEMELQHLRGCLLTILELIERNPGIEAASDDLYQAAMVVMEVDGSKPLLVEARRKRQLREALLRFKDRLVAARPNSHAKSMLH